MEPRHDLSQRRSRLVATRVWLVGSRIGASEGAFGLERFRGPNTRPVLALRVGADTKESAMRRGVSIFIGGRGSCDERHGGKTPLGVLGQGVPRRLPVQWGPRPARRGRNMLLTEALRVLMCLCAGEILSGFGILPFPGPVIGLVLLLAKSRADR